MKIRGVVTKVATGTVSRGKNAGDTWQQVIIEGMSLFVPDDLQNGFCRGQRVAAEVLYKGDRKRLDADGNSLGYQADYELLAIEILPVESL